MNEENARKIGGIIGTVTELDTAYPFWKAKQFFRIKVLVNTEQSLKSGCYMNREDGSRLWLPFRYERLSDFCYHCGQLDHTISACSKKLREKPPPDSPPTQYGPWMRGQSKKQRQRPATHPHPSHQPIGLADRGTVNNASKYPLTECSSSDTSPQTLHQIPCYPPHL